MLQHFAYFPNGVSVPDSVAHESRGLAAKQQCCELSLVVGMNGQVGGGGGGWKVEAEYRSHDHH